MRTLTSDEIIEVKEILKERHPIYYTDPSLYDIFPILKKILWYKKNIQQSDKDSRGEPRILPSNVDRSDTQDLELERYHSHREMKGMSDNKKNLNYLGFGVVAFFDLQRYLLAIFTIMILLLLPSICLFLFYSDGRRFGSSFLNKFTIGNLGFSSTLWKDVSLHVGNLTMTWPTGEMREIVSFGIIPSDGLVNDACLSNSETAKCEESYHPEKLLIDIEEGWLNKSYCTIDPTKHIRAIGEPKWISPYAQFYIQALCMHSEDELKTRNFLNILFWIQVIITASVFIILIYVLARKNQKNYIVWDKMTATISNYTVNLKISSSYFEEFCKSLSSRHQQTSGFVLPKNKSESRRELMVNQAEEAKTPLKCSEEPLSSDSENDMAIQRITDDYSALFAFKNHLRFEFERVLKSTPAITTDDNSQIQVANIHFGFDHIQLYEMLEERGQAIKDSDHDTIDSLETDIIEYVKNNSELLSTPKEVHVTFETEEAMRRALSLCETYNQSLTSELLEGNDIDI